YSRLPMDPATAHLRSIGRRVSTCGSALCLAQLSAAARDAHSNCQHAYSAYAERLQQMNLLLHNVVSDITGVTGMKIIKAILAGERDPDVLALNRQEGCRNSKETIAKSLVGNFRDEHMFALKQAVELYQTYQAMIAECEQ